MKKRNTEATCGNCPYWNYTQKEPSGKVGYCQKNCEVANDKDCMTTTELFWCGDHPDFWQAEKLVFGPGRHNDHKYLEMIEQYEPKQDTDPCNSPT